ncbi:hypothetical protein [Saliniradius amylolyticus]|nr:hypothetical protein [Saliniradius amylolyticus]
MSDSVCHYDIEARDYGERSPFFRPLLEIGEGEVIVPMAEANYARVLRL